jgi:hypothetical protein
MHRNGQFDSAAAILHMICCGVLNAFHELCSADFDLSLRIGIFFFLLVLDSI